MELAAECFPLTPVGLNLALGARNNPVADGVLASAEVTEETMPGVGWSRTQGSGCG